MQFSSGLLGFSILMCLFTTSWNILVVLLSIGESSDCFFFFISLDFEFISRHRFSNFKRFVLLVYCFSWLYITVLLVLQVNYVVKLVS